MVLTRALKVYMRESMFMKVLEKIHTMRAFKSNSITNIS